MSRLKKINSALRIPQSAIKRVIFFLLIFLVIWIPLSWIAARALIVEHPIQHADMIVVLGGSSTYIERTHKAAELWKEGRAPKIFLTNDGLQGGWSNEEKRNPYFVERAKKELLNQGVSEDAIESSTQIVGNTQDEAELLKEVLPKKNVRSVLIVTSPYHTRRAYRIIKNELADTGIEVGIVSPKTGEQSPQPFSWWLSLRGWNLVAGEYVKTIYSKVTGKR